MPSVRTPYLLSKEQQYVVTTCPKCRSSDIRGPLDSRRTATFLFTRAWFCRSCWWDREMQFLDDGAKAEAAARKREAKNKADREKRLGAGA